MRVQAPVVLLGAFILWGGGFVGWVVLGWMAVPRGVWLCQRGAFILWQQKLFNFLETGDWSSLIYIHWVVAPVAVAMVDVVDTATAVHEAGELACVAGEYTDLAEVACVADDLVGVTCAEAAEVHDEGGHLAGWLGGVGWLCQRGASPY